MSDKKPEDISPSPSDTAVAVEVMAKLDKSVFDALVQLANARGVSANTVLQQAIRTEKLLSDNITQNDKLLIKKPNDSYLIVNLARAS